jgi:hypothetical protein
MKKLTPGQQTEIAQLKEECIIFHEITSRRLDDLCNTIDYRRASHLSHIGDRLDLFIKELTAF